MRYTQIDKQTHKVLNIIEAENGYIFDGNYDWVESEHYHVSIGFTYSDEKFYNEDGEELPKNPTELEYTQMQLQQVSSENIKLKSELEEIELYAAIQSTDTDYRLLIIENGLI